MLDGQYLAQRAVCPTLDAPCQSFHIERLYPPDLLNYGLHFFRLRDCLSLDVYSTVESQFSFRHLIEQSLDSKG